MHTIAYIPAIERPSRVIGVFDDKILGRRGNCYILALFLELTKEA